jgi:hypothetical protein
MDIKSLTDAFKNAIDASIAFEAQPVTFTKTRNGWAAYKGDRRITKFFFSESGARTAAEERESAGDEFLHPVKQVHFDGK